MTSFTGSPCETHLLNPIGTQVQKSIGIQALQMLLIQNPMTLEAPVAIQDILICSLYNWLKFLSPFYVRLLGFIY